MSYNKSVSQEITGPARKMTLDAMEKDFTYKIATKLSLSLLENDLISSDEYDKLSKKNEGVFCPFLDGIMH